MRGMGPAPVITWNRRLRMAIAREDTTSIREIGAVDAVSTLVAILAIRCTNRKHSKCQPHVRMTIN
jgi:hypothetical protein